MKVKPIVAACVLALIPSAGSLFAEEIDVLYWMVNDTATVGAGSIEEFFGAAEDSSFAARIRVTGGDITSDTFLDLYWPDGSITSGEFGIDFDDGSDTGYWGAGVPTGNQSPSGAYSSGTPEYSFIVELGNVLYDAYSDSSSWTTIATSAATAYSSLGAYIHKANDLNPGQLAVWTPTDFTVVPEPTGGLLAALGLAVLALRRKRS